jgi:flagellar motor switch protein FliN/FliY
MAENPAEIEALMAEVNALASETAAEIAQGSAGDEVGTQAASPDGAPDLAAQKRGTAGSGAQNLQRVLHLEVPVIVRLAERSMALSGILNLTSGAIIEFEKPADGELDLLINNKCIGHGLAVKVGENFGLRVTRIGSVQERIKALGS